MNAMYLYHPETNTFSNWKLDYPNGAPYPAPDGFEWVNGRPDGLELYRELTLAELLEADFLTELEYASNFLTSKQVGDLFMLKTGITEMLKHGQTEAARAQIEAASIPPELEPIRLKLLSRFS